MPPKAKVRKVATPAHPPVANESSQKKGILPQEPQLLDRTHSPFLDLPPELRGIIYELAAAKLKSVGITSKGRNLITSNHSLSQTSKQVRSEFSAWLVRLNKISTVRKIYAHVHDFNFKRLMRVLAALPANRFRRLYWEASKQNPKLSISLSLSSPNLDAAAAENLGKWAKFVKEANSPAGALFRPQYFCWYTWSDGVVMHKCPFCLGCIRTRKPVWDLVKMVEKITERQTWVEGHMFRSNQKPEWKWELGNWAGGAADTENDVENDDVDPGSDSESEDDDKDDSDSEDSEDYGGGRRRRARRRIARRGEGRRQVRLRRLMQNEDAAHGDEAAGGDMAAAEDDAAGEEDAVGKDDASGALSLSMLEPEPPQSLIVILRLTRTELKDLGL